MSSVSAVGFGSQIACEVVQEAAPSELEAERREDCMISCGVEQHVQQLQQQQQQRWQQQRRQQQRQ